MAASRDLEFRILTRAETSGLEEATRALGDLGEAGIDSTDDLDRIGKALDDVGDEAKRAAREMDGSFDKIGKSAKSGLDRIDDSADKARRGLDDFKDEAQSTGREAAASFSGTFEDVGDAIQETAANAFAGFGPAGAAAGLAAAAGIGILMKAINDAKERVQELATTLIDSGGRLGTDDIFSRIAEAAKDGSIKTLTRQAEQLGVAVSDTAVAFSGSSEAIGEYVDGLKAAKDVADAQGSVQQEVNERIEAGAFAHLGARNAIAENNDATTRLIRTLEGYSRETEKAEEIQRLFAEATGVSLETLQSYEQALTDISGSGDDLADATEAAARRTADATESTKDAWTDYRDTAVGSIDDVIAAQERDIQANLDFQNNAEEVFAAVGEAGVQWALDQGENAAKAMELLANAPKEKQAEVVGNYKAVGTQSGIAVAQGLADGKPAMVRSAGQLHAAVERALDQKVTIPVGLAGGSLTREARIALGRLQAYYSAHPITYRVAYTPSGVRPYRDVP